MAASTRASDGVSNPHINTILGLARRAPKARPTTPPQAARAGASHAGVHHQTDVVPLEEDAADRAPRLLLHQHLLRVVHDEVHVLVEAKDPALDAQVRLLVQPHLHAIPVLQVPKDLVDGEGHDLLELLVADRHGC
uniref:Uncharacterized protein n=1 Tax=Alexandrium andersonii TaxID=327968 RepID=A0A7S2AD42_9DINO